VPGSLQLGQLVDTDDVIGSAAAVGTTPTYRFERHVDARHIAEAVEGEFAPAAAEPGDAFAEASSLGPIEAPTDCPYPQGDPALLPNSERDYHAGTHQGIDFICLARGHVATSPMPGRVSFVVDGYQDPTPSDRSAVLEVAQRVGFLPPWTLVMLYGNVVVIDHGHIDGVGRVETVYAHLDEVDDAMHPGAFVTAGTPVGVIGNHGTATAAANGTRPQSIHLHWEVLIDGHFLGEGLDAGTTAKVYDTLFGRRGRWQFLSGRAVVAGSHPPLRPGVRPRPRSTRERGSLGAGDQRPRDARLARASRLRISGL